LQKEAKMKNLKKMTERELIDSICVAIKKLASLDSDLPFTALAHNIQIGILCQELKSRPIGQIEQKDEKISVAQ